MPAAGAGPVGGPCSSPQSAAMLQPMRAAKHTGARRGWSHKHMEGEGRQSPPATHPYGPANWRLVKGSWRRHLVSIRMPHMPHTPASATHPLAHLSQRQVRDKTGHPWLPTHTREPTCWPAEHQVALAGWAGLAAPNAAAACAACPSLRWQQRGGGTFQQQPQTTNKAHGVHLVVHPTTPAGSWASGLCWVLCFTRTCP